MCGIVGLFLKTPALEPRLGALVTPMLAAMGERGPDSAGIALYRDPAPTGSIKVTLHHPDEDHDWDGLAAALAAGLGVAADAARRGNHCVLTAAATEAGARAWLAANAPGTRIVGVGQAIELFKDRGRPAEVAERFGLAGAAGTHAVGHARMATESAVTTEHAHPFSTGLDLCLVHNGSLSNHNRLRRRLARRGVAFETDNDTEVAAGYLTWRLREGASLAEALEAGLADLDGFYTFAVGTRDGFAVLRDAVACKPAVLAETDDWVAMASEYRSLAHLPGARGAAIWEPAPATVYSWRRETGHDRH